MELTILTPHNKLIEGETVSEFFAPGEEGMLDVLSDHANFVTPLETGVMLWKNPAGKWSQATVSRGFLEIFGDKISVMADVSEMAHEIDVKRARDALNKAMKKLDDGGLDDGHYVRTRHKLARAKARLEAAGEK